VLQQVPDLTLRKRIEQWVNQCLKLDDPDFSNGNREIKQ
jgi:hypothetical protein